MLRELLKYPPAKKKKYKSVVKITANAKLHNNEKLLLSTYNSRDITQNRKKNCLMSNKIRNISNKKNKNILQTVLNSNKTNDKKLKHYSNYSKKTLQNNNPLYDKKLKKIFREIIDTQNNFKDIIKTETSTNRKSVKKNKNIDIKKNKDDEILSLKVELEEMNKMLINLGNKKLQYELENLEINKELIFSQNNIQLLKDKNVKLKLEVLLLKKEVKKYLDKISLLTSNIQNKYQVNKLLNDIIQYNSHNK